MTTNQHQRNKTNSLTPIPDKYWNFDVVTLAKKLIGKRLIRMINNEMLITRIVETEAYHQSESSCHAYRGKTMRNAPLFYPPGYSYLYLTYGIYHCLNVTAENQGIGAAVLIRALEPIEPILFHRALSGPGLLCKHLRLNRFEHNMLDLKKPNNQLWLCENEDFSEQQIESTARIGIKTALDLFWRFKIKDNLYVSK